LGVQPRCRQGISGCGRRGYSQCRARRKGNQAGRRGKDGPACNLSEGQPLAIQVLRHWA